MSNLQKHNYNFKVGKVSAPEGSIERHQNFDKLLSDYRTLTTDLYRKPLYKNPKMFMGLMLIFICAFLVFQAVEEEEKLYRFDEVHPPIEQMDIPFEVYEVDAAVGDTIEHSSGSKIIIPPNAFIDKEGNAVKGVVRINYREIQNPAEMFAAGIALNDAGEILESNGMMEIYGNQGGEPVFVSQQKGIQMMLLSTSKLQPNTLLPYNLYYRDPLISDWNQIDQPIKYEESHAGIVKVVDEDKCHFELDIDYEEFPEFQIFETVWEFKADPSDEPANPCAHKEVFTKEWENVSIEELGEVYKILFENSTESFETFAVPVFAESGMEIDSVGFTVSESDNLMYQYFSVNQFGIWNCDRPWALDEYKQLKVTFEDADGKTLELVGNVWMMYEDVNTVCIFYEDENGSYPVCFRPDVGNRLFGFNGKGEFYLSQNDLMQNMNLMDTSAVQSVKMDLMNPDPKKLEDLSVLLKFNSLLE